MADIKGILNVLFAIGIFYRRSLPFTIWHWGTVGEIIGYRTPLQKFGEYKVEKPVNGVIFGI